jgi:hypothetical protein
MPSLFRAHYYGNDETIEIRRALSRRACVLLCGRTHREREFATRCVHRIGHKNGDKSFAPFEVNLKGERSFRQLCYDIDRVARWSFFRRDQFSP